MALGDAPEGLRYSNAAAESQSIESLALDERGISVPTFCAAVARLDQSWYGVTFKGFATGVCTLLHTAISTAQKFAARC